MDTEEMHFLKAVAGQWMKDHKRNEVLGKKWE
jgi:hypothetical protein